MSSPFQAPAVSLRVNDGQGRLVRRTEALFFCPSGAEGLVEVFDQAESNADAVRQVQQRVVANEFGGPAFSIVDWSDGIVLTVFGDVEITTTLPSAPMLSGRGSTTWVEHRVTVADLAALKTDGAVVSVGAGADATSDLRLGVARSSGFELQLGQSPRAGSPAVASNQPQADRPPVAIAAPAKPVVPVAASAPADEPEDQTVDDVAGDDVAGDDVAGDEVPVGEVPGNDVAAHNVVIDEVPVDPHGEQPGSPAVDTGPLVESAMCTSGHPNPPRTMACRRCGLAVDAQPDSWQMVSQPVVGRLTMPDGTGVDIDRSLIIGRKPTSKDRAVQTVEVAGNDVSRSHVLISVEGWAVTVTDLSSRNGTYLRIGEDPTPIPIIPGVQQLLEAGTVIHLGSPDVVLNFTPS